MIYPELDKKIMPISQTKLISKNNLAKTLGHALKQAHWIVTTAESCTGGGIAKAITAINGSSAWFEQGFVTYSNQAKITMLDVKTETLMLHGAVSEAVVKEMALGALKKSSAHIAVAVSGIAGPTGGTKDKPVGTVWIAWATQTQIIAQRFLFDGDRKKVRKQTIKTALREMIKRIPNSA